MTKHKKAESLIPVERIENKILFIRDQRVMLDRDLAELYGVETRVLNQAVTRNSNRFPDDFMFQLTKEEQESLRSQSVISNKGRGGRRYRFRAFTEQGVAMLSSVLNSERAIQINIQIMRAFIKLKDMALERMDYDDLWKRLDIHELETQEKFREVIEALKLMDARISFLESSEDHVYKTKYKH
jgi:hypothetical protein